MIKRIIETMSAFAFVCSAYAQYDVAAYVWPAFQPEPRWKELGIFDHGNGEWQNMYEAVPKFAGHKQPKVPLWGYENEADPIVVARRIDAALAAGINVFVYDWYWYEGRPFLENALNEGFLKAPNNERMKFYIMWANHNVDRLWNNKVADKKGLPPIWKADVSLDEFKKIADRVVSQYFTRPNYYKIDNKPVFSMFRPMRFLHSFGGADGVKEAIKYLDDACKKAGFDGVFILPIFKMKDFQKEEIAGVENATTADLLKQFGIDTVTCYSWITFFDAATRDISYDEWGTKVFDNYGKFSDMFKARFIPNVTIGWDNNPRFPANVRTAMCVGNSPAEFEKFLRKAKAWVDKQDNGLPKLILLNAWNEWPEGSYLEPDTDNGYGYLNACARVFGGSGQSGK